MIGAYLHDVGAIMMCNLESMTTDELFELYQQVGVVLRAKMIAQKTVLDRRLQKLKQSSDDQDSSPTKSRRPHPPVIPKFRNPDQLSETWSGRGKRPAWLSAQLKSGRRIDDFRIGPATGGS